MLYLWLLICKTLEGFSFACQTRGNLFSKLIFTSTVNYIILVLKALLARKFDMMDSSYLTTYWKAWGTDQYSSMHAFGWLWLTVVMVEFHKSVRIWSFPYCSFSPIVAHALRMVSVFRNHRQKGTDEKAHMRNQKEIETYTFFLFYSKLLSPLCLHKATSNYMYHD